MRSRSWRSGAVFLILAGIFLLLINLNIIPWDLKELWPVLLIALGLAELFDF